jgi:hypothetical protein
MRELRREQQRIAKKSLRGEALTEKEISRNAEIASEISARIERQLNRGRIWC